LSLSIYLIVALHIPETFAVVFFSVLLEKGSQENLSKETNSMFISIYLSKGV